MYIGYTNFEKVDISERVFAVTIAGSEKGSFTSMKRNTMKIQNKNE